MFFKENRIFESVIPIMASKLRDAKCRSGAIYCSVYPKQLNRRVRDEFDDYIILAIQHDVLSRPIIFLAAKGPDGSITVARRQASYDGALGVKGQQRFQSYGQNEPIYDNNAYIITLICYGGTLKIYTNHVI